MENKELNTLVKENFKDLVCPLCYKEIPINIGHVNMPHHFKDCKDSQYPKCKEQMKSLNDLVKKLQYGEFSPSDLPQHLVQYRQ